MIKELAKMAGVSFVVWYLLEGTRPKTAQSWIVNADNKPKDK